MPNVFTKMEIEKRLKKLIKPAFYKFLEFSIRRASKEQKLVELVTQLRSFVPNVTHQYTTHNIDSSYLENKVRALHALQVHIASYAIDQLDTSRVTIVDIGDSAGTHLEYLSKLYPNKINPYSVNRDPIAVKKIAKKGIKAINGRAEDLSSHPDFNELSIEILLLFETLEHLFDPIGFLDTIHSAECKYFAITIPYVKKSRVGFSQIRNKNDQRKITPENTHIFELSPDDWEIIFKFTGWEVVYRKIYRQYPAWSRVFFLNYLWRVFDFEGFYGVVLKANHTNKKYLQAWRS